MKITTEQIGKRYRYEWIFKGVDKIFEAPKKYAILGANGSGKSTLMKVLSGYLSPSKGSISFQLNQRALSIHELYRYVGFTGPYIDLIEEFTLTEIVQFHQQFKTFQNGLNTKSLIDLMFLQKSKNQAIKSFSSGMKQRLKLGLTICSDSPVLLLDEPTTNLDKVGAAWYRQLIEDYTDDRLVIVASNVQQDYDFCDEQLFIEDYKKTSTKSSKI